jgi:hypothetical protein
MFVRVAGSLSCMDSQVRGMTSQMRDKRSRMCRDTSNMVIHGWESYPSGDSSRCLRSVEVTGPLSLKAPSLNASRAQVLTTLSSCPSLLAMHVVTSSKHVLSPLTGSKRRIMLTRASLASDLTLAFVLSRRSPTCQRGDVVESRVRNNERMSIYAVLSFALSPLFE